jgi:dolichyl-phosphate-mannose--protein O-mannosyl transferase
LRRSKRLDIWCGVAALVMTMAATLAVATTHRIFSNVFDEPAHIATGLEWLSRGTYHFEAQHPPLGRIATAVGPYLAGARTDTASRDMFAEGRRVLGKQEQYRDMLRRARLGVLPFFVLGCAAAWLLGRRIGGPATGAIAVALTATNPNVLAHAGFATIDMAVAATFALAWYAWLR